jgi:hypothetical protein
MRDGHTEEADDRIADELLDDTAVLLDPCTRQRVVAAKEPVELLGIETLSELRRPDEIAKQRGDDLAL